MRATSTRCAYLHVPTHHQTGPASTDLRLRDERTSGAGSYSISDSRIEKDENSVKLPSTSQPPRTQSKDSDESLFRGTTTEIQQPRALSLQQKTKEWWRRKRPSVLSAADGDRDPERGGRSQEDTGEVDKI